jgi:hypothetical protein
MSVDSLSVVSADSSKASSLSREPSVRGVGFTKLDQYPLYNTLAQKKMNKNAMIAEIDSDYDNEEDSDYDNSHPHMTSPSYRNSKDQNSTSSAA